MNEIETAAFWVAYNEMRDSEQRVGQAMMNALRYVAPELYSEITGSKYDIFYRDTSQDIYRFREYLGI